MKIHGLCIVKDEADVIAECLEASLAWCDHVYVFDNGSTDGTWQIVQALAARHPAIVPFKQDPAPFHDGLRAQIHDAYRQRTEPGDWWCRLDADEFYVDDPRTFLAKVPMDVDYVVTAIFAYYFTELDAAAWQADDQAFNATPVTRRLRHYLNHWSEPRFMRADPARAWGPDQGGWPRWMHAGRAYPVRIWVKHYAYRSPPQIERRLATRRGAIDSGAAFAHEAVHDFPAAIASVTRTGNLPGRPAGPAACVGWRQRVVPASALHYDDQDRRLVVNEHLMPPIPGQPALGTARLSHPWIAPLARAAARTRLRARALWKRVRAAEPPRPRPSGSTS